MIIKSPYPEVSIPDTALTPFILQKAAEIPDKPALIDGATGRVVTYSQLVDSIGRVAAGLRQRGFKKGDVFGILSPNNPDYAIAFHAVALLGGTVTTINPLYTEQEIAHQLKDAGARYLVTVPLGVNKAKAAGLQAGIKELFVFGESPGITPFSSLLGEERIDEQVPVNPAEDLVALPYSSGTTGLPKGVMLTHRNLVANIKQMEGLCYFFETDTLICVLPLFHIYGLMVVLNMGLYTGATIVTMPRFDLEAFLKAAKDYDVSLAHLVPPIILNLSKNPIVDDYQLPKLRVLFSGAAPLGEDLTRACMDRLGVQIRQGYGLTETSPVTHSSPAPTADIKFGSVGVCAPSTECRIVSLETGKDLGPMERGEVCIRGPQVMIGYLNKPEATALTIDSEGWLHTGDIGYADEDGHFFIVDRAKELIKYKGFQVPPAELEALLLTHPCVEDAAVIPCPDDEAGEVPKALIVLKTHSTEEDILSFVSDRVAPHKRIRYVEFMEQIPKSPSGKILRRVLVDRERAKSAAS
jgi:acyl-CoA synthetase (AMP-forming)/AMP-acid ligase II